MKRRRKETNKGLYLLNMILFIGFSFEFYIRKDNFLGTLLIFNGLVNLLAFQQAPKKIGSITVILVLFNLLLSATVAYNYLEINYEILFYIWSFIAFSYFIIMLSDAFNLIRYRHFKKKHRSKS